MRSVTRRLRTCVTSVGKKGDTLGAFSQVSIRTCSCRVEGLSQIRASTRSFVSPLHCMRRNAVDLNHNRNNVDVDINRTMPWIFTCPWFGADGEWHCNFDVIGTGF